MRGFVVPRAVPLYTKRLEHGTRLLQLLRSDVPEEQQLDECHALVQEASKCILASPDWRQFEQLFRMAEKGSSGSSTPALASSSGSPWSWTAIEAVVVYGLGSIYAYKAIISAGKVSENECKRAGMRLYQLTLATLLVKQLPQVKGKPFWATQK